MLIREITLYELALIGVPTIAIAIADNQLKNVFELNKKGLINYIGFYDDENIFENLLKAILLLKYENRLKISKLLQNQIDGKGVTRLVRIIES